MKTSFLNSLAISACKTFLNCACIKNEGEFHGEMKCEDELKCSHLASISLMDACSWERDTGSSKLS